MKPAASSAWALPISAGEALGLLVAPLPASLICALPVLVAGSAVGAACVAILYLAVFGITPNFALGRLLLRWARSRRLLTLSVSLAGGSLTKVAAILLVFVIGPPFVLVFDGGDRVFVRWSELATIGAWAFPVAAVLGAIEGATFWIAAKGWDRRVRVGPRRSDLNCP